MKVPPVGEAGDGHGLPGVGQPPAAGALQRTPGAGPADDDTLLARTDTALALEAVDVEADVPDTGSDSGMSSTVDAAHANRKWLSSG